MWNTVSRAAVAGGALWIVFAVLAAGLPSGCVGDACLLQSHRDLGDLERSSSPAALLLLLAFASSPPAPARPRPPRSPAASRSSSPGPLRGPLVRARGARVAACVVGFALGSPSSAPARRRAGSARCSWRGSLALFAANDQDDRVLLVIPFALAWMCVGAVLLRSSRASTSRTTPA